MDRHATHNQQFFAAPALATGTPSQVLTDILTPISAPGLDFGWKRRRSVLFLLEKICEEMMCFFENTSPKFSMEPENDGFQKESPFPGTSFRVPC